jgi:hypothetical protein
MNVGIETVAAQELSIRHISTDGFAGTGSPARQFLGPHIPEQSVRHPHPGTECAPLLFETEEDY